MKKVILMNDTVVRFAKGTVLEVSDQEAARLIAFNNAAPAPEEKPAKPAAKKATAKKG